MTNTLAYNSAALIAAVKNEITDSENALAFNTEVIIRAINVEETSSNKCTSFTVLQCYLLIKSECG